MGTRFLMPKFYNMIYRDCLLVSHLTASLLGIMFVIFIETVACILSRQRF